MRTLHFISVDQDAFFKCPDRLRLPLIFYYGHTAAVYVNKLILAGLLQVSAILLPALFAYIHIRHFTSINA